MDVPLISVIIPVYNVERYLDRCVQSIVDQTWSNLEIILVDDGSPDNCPAMCDAWAEKDSRIKVIHKENGGLSDARNAGMAIASGTYMGFVDSDDWIKPEMYQLLYERMLEDGSDIAACGVEMVYEDGRPSCRMTPEGNCVLDQTAALEALIWGSRLKHPVWYKLYKTDLIRDLRFPVGKYHEDVFWTWQAVIRADKVSVLDTLCYSYVQRSGSIMGESFSEKRLDAIEAGCRMQDYLQAHCAKLAGEGAICLCFSALYFGQLALRTMPCDESAGIIRKLSDATARYPIPRAALRTKKITHRIWLTVAKRNMMLACRLRNRLGIGL